ncbi:hypothetical protein K456DRAFT_56823 [Colletotrichum gloeosporioides 23]|nr:hypothetical protein K456DRAFT_56823 [Colletotrichum gloeosporioides 23]
MKPALKVSAFARPFLSMKRHNLIEKRSRKNTQLTRRARARCLDLKRAQGLYYGYAVLLNLVCDDKRVVAFR